MVNLNDFDTDWLGVDVDEDSLFNPLEYVFSSKNLEESRKKMAVLMSDPDYFYFVCKYVLNIELLPFQAVIIKELWDKKFPILLGSRGCSKSMCLAVYCILRCLLIPKRKIVVVGAAFRQSKVVFGYIEDIWNNAPVLRSLCPNRQDQGPRKDVDKCVLRINNSIVTCLPLGDGEKIRGMRAHDIIGEEFQSIPVDIFERIVAGFGNVAQNPVDKVKDKARQKMGRKKENDYSDYALVKENQIILCGTAYYSFNHFAKYWEKYKKFISTRGDSRRISEVSNNADSSAFKWDHYTIMRFPIEVLPEGLMDEGMIARLKATVHSGTYMMECSCVFSNDSQGFFKRTLIEKCCLTKDQTFSFPSCGEVFFEASLKGRPGTKHVFGVDPAADKDNFSIVVLEVNPDHRRIVHCWTTNRKQHREKLDSNITKEADYYRYCGRKIRDLMRNFSCYEIALDMGGGGVGIEEVLHDSSNLQEGELPIWPCIEEDKEKPTDDKPGLHILRKCNFAKADWLGEANHGLRKDFEDKILLFPYYDTVTLELSYDKDYLDGRSYDNLEDCVLNIEELKDELSSIVISLTPSGKERWDTPESKSDIGKKISQKKDRYSALLIANMSARTKQESRPFDGYELTGGFARVNTTLDENHDQYFPVGPDWWTSSMKGFRYE